VPLFVIRSRSEFWLSDLFMWNFGSRFPIVARAAAKKSECIESLALYHCRP
jgi:hypothetical protein